MKSRLSLTVEVAVLATILVAADAVTGSNVRWTECGGDRALMRVRGVELLPSRPRAGDIVRVVITGDLPVDVRTSEHPKLDVSVYYDFFSWNLVAQKRGPLCGAGAFTDCPIPRDPAASIRGTMRVLSAAIAGRYKIVFAARVGDGEPLFCVAARVRFD